MKVDPETGEEYWDDVFGIRFKTFTEFMLWSGYRIAPPPRMFTQEEMESIGKVPPMTEPLSLQFYKDYAERTKKDKQDG